MDVVAPPFREKVVTFGDAGALVGVLTTPASPRAGAPHVVLLNSGILHRVGANRIHVRFARDFATEGLTTLRFDLSGIGDSARSTRVDALQDVVNRDIEAALTLLSEKHGASQFLLVGLCSGAYDALQAAQRDPRVTGIVLLDIPGPFQDWHHFAHRVAARAKRPHTWAHAVRRMARAARNPSAAATAAAVVPENFGDGVRPQSTRELMGRDLQSLLQRSVRMFFIFTPGVPDNYNHRGQFRRCFPQVAAHPLVSFEYLPESDHTFSTRGVRDKITALIRNWIVQSK